VRSGHPRSGALLGLALGLAFGLGAAPRALAQPALPQPLEVNVRGSSAGSFVARTSTDTAPREPIDAASMIDELPGVQVRRLGGDGAFASISVRGSAPSQVGVVLGGIPLTSAADPAFDVGSLPLWPGASFRVYRGFAPAALGTTGYLGGVLVIDPPSPAVGGRTEWWAGAGSFGALKLRLGDLRRVNGVEIGSGFYASRTDGDFPYFHQDQLGAGPLVELRRINAGQAVVGGIERVAVERSWGTVSGLVLADARRAGVPGDVEGLPVHFASLSTTRLLAGLDASLRTGERGAARLSGWARRETSSLEDPLNELRRISATTTRSAVESGGLSAGWRGRIADPLVLSAILDGRVERFHPLSTEGFQASAPASRFTGGLGVDLEWRPREALTATAAARLDARRDQGSGFFSAGAPADAVAGGFLPTGHLGASYRFDAAAILSAHAGLVARPPSFVELYGNGASLVAAPRGLAPEHAFSADLGFAGDLAMGRVQLGYELVAFASDARDLIVFQPLGANTSRALNVAHALLAGGEVSASLSAPGLRTQVSYTLLVAQDRVTGNPLPGRPRHDLAYDASYALGPARLRYGVDLVSGMQATAGLPLPPRISHSAGFALDVPFAPGLRVAVDVQNLFDQRILWLASRSKGLDAPQVYVPYPLVDFLRYPLPGRTVWATLRFSRPNVGR
jgi:iron complex outermembrane receptor protein